MNDCDINNNESSALIKWMYGMGGGEVDGS